MRRTALGKGGCQDSSTVSVTWRVSQGPRCWPSELQFALCQVGLMKFPKAWTRGSSVLRPARCLMLYRCPTCKGGLRPEHRSALCLYLEARTIKWAGQEDMTVTLAPFIPGAFTSHSSDSKDNTLDVSRNPGAAHGIQGAKRNHYHPFHRRGNPGCLLPVGTLPLCPTAGPQLSPLDLEGASLASSHWTRVAVTHSGLLRVTSALWMSQGLAELRAVQEQASQTGCVTDVPAPTHHTAIYSTGGPEGVFEETKRHLLLCHTVPPS